MKNDLDKAWRGSVESFRPRGAKRERRLSRRLRSTWTKPTGCLQPGAAMTTENYFSFCGSVLARAPASDELPVPLHHISRRKGHWGKTQGRCARRTSKPPMGGAERGVGPQPSGCAGTWLSRVLLAGPSEHALQARKTRASHSLWST